MPNLSFLKPLSHLLEPPVDGPQPEEEPMQFGLLGMVEGQRRWEWIWQLVENIEPRFYVKVGSAQIYIPFHVMMNSLRRDELYMQFTDNIQFVKP